MGWSSNDVLCDQVSVSDRWGGRSLRLSTREKGIRGMWYVDRLAMAKSRCVRSLIFNTIL